MSLVAELDDDEHQVDALVDASPLSYDAFKEKERPSILASLGTHSTGLNEDIIDLELQRRWKEQSTTISRSPAPIVSSPLDMETVKKMVREEATKIAQVEAKKTLKQVAAWDTALLQKFGKTVHPQIAKAVDKAVDERYDEMSSNVIALKSDITELLQRVPPISGEDTTSSGSALRKRRTNVYNYGPRKAMKQAPCIAKKSSKKRVSGQDYDAFRRYMHSYLKKELIEMARVQSIVVKKTWSKPKMILVMWNANYPCPYMPK